MGGYNSQQASSQYQQQQQYGGMAQNGPAHQPSSGMQGYGGQGHHQPGAGGGGHQMHNGEVMQRQPNTVPRKGRFTEKTTLLSSDDEFQ